jgi:hypothetical protein
MVQKRYTEREEAFWRRRVRPEEDRDEITGRKGYRWFRSANVVAIEHYRPATRVEPRSKAV